jgi:hypothetical protein
MFIAAFISERWLKFANQIVTLKRVQLIAYQVPSFKTLWATGKVLLRAGIEKSLWY